MPGRPPSELASLSLLLQFRVLQDWGVGAVIGRGQTVQQGVSHPLLGAGAGLTPPPAEGFPGQGSAGAYMSGPKRARASPA